MKKEKMTKNRKYFMKKEKIRLSDRIFSSVGKVYFLKVCFRQMYCLCYSSPAVVNVFLA